MNAASSKTGFRGFASKLRDQAKDAVGNYKLPTFDDMAKKDDYIHTPGFNVRSSGKSEKKTLRREEEITPENSIATNGTSLNGTTDEASYYSTESSWSLLDRPASTDTGRVPGGKTTVLTTSVAMAELNQSVRDDHNRLQQNGNNDNKASSVPERMIEQSKKVVQSSIISNISRQDVMKSSVSLFSVVSDALQPTTPIPVPAASATKDCDDDDGRSEYRMKKMSQHYVDNEDVSDQSSEVFDEEDPIFSIIRNNNNSTSSSSDKNYAKNSKKRLDSDDAPASMMMIKKSSNRFMEDLRLQAPAEQDPGFDAIAKFYSTASSTTKSEIEAKGIVKGDSVGGYLKNAAIQNFNRIVLRRGSNNQSNNNQATAHQQLPPLARERKPIPELEQRDAFQMTASTSAGMLSDEDINQLKQLKIARESSSALSSLSIIQTKIQMLKEYLHEHRLIMFVIFTLLLSILVYFRRGSTSKMI